MKRIRSFAAILIALALVLAMPLGAVAENEAGDFNQSVLEKLDDAAISAAYAALEAGETIAVGSKGDAAKGLQ